MVLTVTLNPLLEKKLYFENTNSYNNRAYKEEYLAGGKGVNISRQLNLFGIQNHALLYLGGANGKRLRSILEYENISFSATSTKNETREACLIFDDEEKSLTTYFGVNTTVTKSEIELFLSKLEKAIINSSIVVFAGSLPNDEASIIIEKGIELCNKYDKISIVDTYGKQLKKYISLGPTIIHNNIDEIKNSLEVSLENEEEISKVLMEFYNHGTNLAFITNGKVDIFASKADFHYKISVPKVIEKDATGSGDAFVAGIIYGLEKSLIFNDFVKLAASLGAQNAASWEVCKVDPSSAKKLEDDVSIVEIGKKIKLIDDSPTI